jgi:hypothetical protein
VLCLAMFLCGQAAAQFDYTNVNGTITITGYHGSGGDVTVPDAIDGLPVTAIGTNAFLNQTNINVLRMPDSVTRIGAHAFDGCIWLFGVTLSTNLPSIEDWTFAWCFQLTAIDIPQSVTNMGQYAFGSCDSLTEVTIPGSVKTIGDYSFEACGRLGKVTISNGVRNIGNYAFNYCGGLSTVLIGETVTDIGVAAFNSCSNLLSVVIPASVRSVGNGAFFCGPRLKAVYFEGDAPPDWYAFGSNPNATVYYMPGRSGWPGTFSYLPTVLWNPRAQIAKPTGGIWSNGIELTLTGSTNLSIVVEACTNLAQPTWIPIATNTLLDGVSHFNDLTATNSTSRFYRLGPAMPLDYTWYVTNGMAFITSYTGPAMGTWVVPTTINGVPVAGIWRTFAVPGLTNLTIPDGILNLDLLAFADSDELQTVTIGNTVTNIGTAAFASCRSLTNVVIGNNVRSIGESAFENCYQLARITIPASVTNISTDVNFPAFGYCPNLTQINVDGANPTYSSAQGVLFNKDRTTLVQFPRGKGGTYVIPLGTRRIGGHAFEQCNGLTNVVMLNLVEIEHYAFDRCANLTNVNLPNTVTSIDDFAFRGCTSVKTVKIGASVTNIGQYAFGGCSMSSVIIPNSVREIGVGAFEQCFKLGSVTLSTNLETLRSNVFTQCSSLTNIFLPAGLINLESPSFQDCGRLTAINVDALNPIYSGVDGVLFDKSGETLILAPAGRQGAYVIPARVTHIADFAFQYSQLTNIAFPDSLIEIGQDSFFQSFLRALTIPDGVRNIGKDAFASSLVGTASIGNGVTNIGTYAFGFCPSLTNVTIGTGLLTLSDGAFGYCWYLKAVYFNGNAPVPAGLVFDDTLTTVYFRAGTTGWGPFFAGRPTAIW